MFKELLKTATREKKDKNAKNFTIETMDEFDASAASFATFIENVAKDAKQRIAFTKAINAAGSDDLIQSLYTINSELDKFLSLPAIEKRLEVLAAETVAA